MPLPPNSAYELTVRQQPKQARMCGSGEKADRRPIDPPPIIRLRIRRPGSKGGSKKESDFISPTLTHSLFMFASLVPEDSEEELYMLSGSRTKHVTGSVVSSLFHLKDQSCFVFPDLSVRTEGKWRFKMSMYEILEDGVHFCSSIVTDTFQVYSSKRFPGMGQSTDLSRAFASQGLRLRIRRPNKNDDENSEPLRDDDDTHETATSASSRSALPPPIAHDRRRIPSGPSSTHPRKRSWEGEGGPPRQRRASQTGPESIHGPPAPPPWAAYARSGWAPPPPVPVSARTDPIGQYNPGKPLAPPPSRDGPGSAYWRESVAGLPPLLPPPPTHAVPDALRRGSTFPVPPPPFHSHSSDRSPAFPSNFSDLPPIAPIRSHTRMPSDTSSSSSTPVNGNGYDSSRSATTTASGSYRASFLPNGSRSPDQRNRSRFPTSSTSTSPPERHGGFVRAVESSVREEAEEEKGEGEGEGEQKKPAAGGSLAMLLGDEARSAKDAEPFFFDEAPTIALSSNDPVKHVQDATSILSIDSAGCPSVLVQRVRLGPEKPSSERGGASPTLVQLQPRPFNLPRSRTITETTPDGQLESRSGRQGLEADREQQPLAERGHGVVDHEESHERPGSSGAFEDDEEGGSVGTGPGWSIEGRADSPGIEIAADGRRDSQSPRFAHSIVLEATDIIFTEAPELAGGNTSRRPTPNPLQIYLSQSHFLSETSPPEVRAAMLDLLQACIDASLDATGGLSESDKAIYWGEVRRWAVEAKIEIPDGESGMRWVLPDADREALVGVLSAMTKGGKLLSDVPGLVSLLCTFVTDSLPYPPPPSPLFDPTMETPFIHTTPPTPSRHTSSLALLTALHKFSAPHIFPASTLIALRAALDISRLQEESDFGGHVESGVLGFVGAVVRYGEVAGDVVPRNIPGLLEESMERPDGREGDEILKEIVGVVARLVGCEGLVGVVEVDASGASNSSKSRMRPSILPEKALSLMRDLLRSPANQALKSLRATLVAPPTTSPPPPAPELLLVGALRSLRKAFEEHSADTEATARGETTSGSTGESRWPSMLSLGLPFLWENIRRILLWKSAYVDAEVLRLVEERLEAADRLAVKTKEGAMGVMQAGEEEGGISYEEWDMAIEVLTSTMWHIGAWEAANRKPWIWSDREEDEDAGGVFSEPEEGEPTEFKQRPGVLDAFSTLLQRVVAAWQHPGFVGPSERVFTLLISLAPHLSDAHAHAVIEQSDRNDLCLPSHPEWLERTQEVVRAFYRLPAPDSPRASRRAASSATRQRALQFLASLHSHLRPLEELRQKLVSSVVMPLLETTFETESDVDVVEILLTLLVEIARDVLPMEESAASSGGQDLFGRIRSLLVKVATGAVRPPDRYSASTSSSAKQKRGAALSSRYTESSTSAMRASPSISAPTVQQGPTPEGNDVPFLAILALISIFHLCLARSTPSASERAILVFRDLLALLDPTGTGHSAEGTEPTLPLRTRVVILQWLVRLRADAAHRIHWVKDVDITASASILGRITTPASSEIASDALASAAGIGADEGLRPEPRGRPTRQSQLERGGRDASGSRVRVRSVDRSPSRGLSNRRGTQSSIPPPMPTLWSVPERLPFDFGEDVRSVGGQGLASFDHNRMRSWTEEEDPGTGQFTVREVEVTDQEYTEPAMVVLPVSEYLRTINNLLQAAQDWELVSYILCHLPEQLSNKHLACGPRAALQLHHLRTQLCNGLRGISFLSEIPLPSSVKRAEVHAAAYVVLTSLIAYRGLFTKRQQDDMVESFIYGLGNPRDTAKVCIHALAMATFELRPSMTKYLAEIVRHLQKIISTATLGVHILELIAGIGQEPSLYANFTELDFQTVFGIALKYIQAHNERLLENPETADGEGIEYAFSQYVFLLAYLSITSWYLALRLSERPKYVPFLTRRLIQANEGKPEIDEPTEVCFDMIARYTYSNADPRPRHSAFDNSVSKAGAVPGPPSSKTWIVGTATVTIKSLAAPAWVEVTVRRPSGVVRMLWELQNISGVRSSSDSDSIAMYLRHRETAQVASSIPSVVSEALASIPSPTSQPYLGHRARAATVTGTSTVRTTIEETTIARSVNLAATSAQQPTLESGLLSVDPSFFILQLSAFPDFNKVPPPLLVPNDAASQRGLAALDRMPIVDFHKIGVLYAGPGQTTERAILNNTHGSKSYINLISALGRLVRLKGSRELDIYTGGLDQETDIDGKWTYIWDDDISQIVFHIATLMPTSPETDPQATLKKRHIGNDFVKIVYNDSGSEFAFDTLPGDFNFVNIVIQPHTPAGNPWMAPGMTENDEFFKVTMQCRPGMPEVGPLGAFKMVTSASLPDFVRQLSLHSNIFAQIYLASVGFEARQGTQKLEYSSNWRKRLQQIKMLKKRIQDSGGGGAAKVLEGGSEPLDLDQAEAARLFTSWL
ncbi:tuberin [Pseudohyphozyma bogoriensis]|nr:tuberin [Pseudohyphozyma bogoriensis]